MPMLSVLWHAGPFDVCRCAMICHESNNACVHQCWCWADWCVHHPEHRLGKNEVRGSGRPVPDRQDSANSEAGHGADRGISLLWLYKAVITAACRSLLCVLSQ